VEREFSPSRSKAVILIKQGLVKENGRVVKKPGQLVDPVGLTVEEHDLPVGRGANKLSSVLSQIEFPIEDRVFADLGASTGGFTEVLLKLGAKKVYAIDVGHDQLAKELNEDPRVINLEGINLKHSYDLEEKVGGIVADLSFISIQLIAPNIVDFLNEEGSALILIKPQFEVGPEAIGKSGIVKDQKKVKEAIRNAMDSFRGKGMVLLDLIPSGVTGKKGNQEYFLHMTKDQRKKDQQLKDWEGILT
jgi:23S rRNA (cytidine1920-2'-O)/16S rRNA (cytidine1409-2'-O)-methyltransferase